MQLNFSLWLNWGIVHCKKWVLHFLRASVTGTMLTGRLVSPTWVIRFLEICKAGTLGEFLWIWNLLWIQTEKTVFCDSNFLNFDIKWHGAKIIIVYILNLVNIITKENIFVNIIRNANICFVISQKFIIFSQNLEISFRFDFCWEKIFGFMEIICMKIIHFILYVNYILCVNYPLYIICK